MAELEIVNTVFDPLIVPVGISLVTLTVHPLPELPEVIVVTRHLESTVTFALVYVPAPTPVEESVAQNVPVPLHVTSHVRVIVWSPVLVPERFDNLVFSAAVTNLLVVDESEMLSAFSTTTPVCPLTDATAPPSDSILSRIAFLVGVSRFPFHAVASYASSGTIMFPVNVAPARFALSAS